MNNKPTKARLPVLTQLCKQFPPVLSVDGTNSHRLSAAKFPYSHKGWRIKLFF